MLASLLRSSVSSSFYYGQRILGRRPQGTRILSYHSIREEKNYICVSPREFRNQMEYLAKENYRSVSLTEIVKGLSDPKAIAITFDDGYRDNFETAMPMLQEFGFTATIFCVAGKVGTHPYLNWKDLETMTRAGFEVGGHSVSHPNLKTLKGNDKWREISESKRIMEDIVPAPCRFFCYPYGQWDRESLRLVREAGYLGACTNIPGSNHNSHPYLLRRTEISGFDRMDDFAKKISGAYDLMHQALHLVRGRP